MNESPYDKKEREAWEAKQKAAYPGIKHAFDAVAMALTLKKIPYVLEDKKSYIGMFPYLRVGGKDDCVGITIDVNQERPWGYRSCGSGVFYIKASGVRRQKTKVFPLKKDGTFSVDKLIEHVVDGWASHLRREESESREKLARAASEKFVKELSEKYEGKSRGYTSMVCPVDSISLYVNATGACSPEEPQVQIELNGNFSKDKAVAIIEALRKIFPKAVDA